MGSSIVQAVGSLVTGGVTNAFRAMFSAIKSIASGIISILKKIVTGFAMIGAAAAAASAVGVFMLIRSFCTYADEVSRMIQAEARVEQMVRTTGQAAGWTAKQLILMAEGMMKRTGVMDEEILEAMAILQSFKSVAGDVFKRTTEAALDMSALLGQSVTGSMMQLGKAMEDPIRGMSRLRRSGVTLNEEQQKEIKLLQESGDLRGAQSKLLDIIEGQLGGVAEAMAKTPVGQMKLAKHMLGEITDEIGKKMIPVLQMWGRVKLQLAKATKVLADKVFAMIDAYGGMERIGRVIRTAFIVMREVGAKAMSFLVDTFEKGIEWINGAGSTMATNFKNTFMVIVENLDVMLGSWSGFKAGLLHLMSMAGLGLQEIWEHIKHVFITIWTHIVSFAQAAWDTFLTFLDSTFVDEILGMFTGLGKSIAEKMLLPTINMVPQAVAALSLLKVATKGEAGKEAMEATGKAAAETARGAMIAVEETLAAVAEQAQSRATAALGKEDERYEGALENLRKKMKQEGKLWDEMKEDLPKFSDMVKKAWKEAGVPVGFLEKPDEVGPPSKTPPPGMGGGLGGPGIEGGRFGFAEYGKHLQDLFMKTSDPQERTARATEATAAAAEGTDAKIGEFILRAENGNNEAVYSRD